MNKISLLLTGIMTGAIATAWVFSLETSRAQSATLPSPAAPAPVEPAEDGMLRIIAFGAHPDDAEIKVGGAAAMWAKLGHHVKLVSVTNGDIGHWQMAGGPLAQRRTREVEKCAQILGIDEVEVLDIHDGEVMPTLDNRRKIVRLIREWKADIVLSHRPNDYHPDHRYTGVLVQDASFMVTVPFFCPDTPYLEKNPVFLYYVDRFQRPNPSRGDVVISIDRVMDRKLNGLAALESQFIEGGCCKSPSRDTSIPRNKGDYQNRVRSLRDGFRAYYQSVADTYRDGLIEFHGQERGENVQYAEAFEICEYGRQPTADDLKELFPFD